MVYLITYDLNKAKDYPKLYEAIKSIGEWARDPDLDSVWFVSTSLTAQSIYDRLRPHIDSDDRLFITQLHRGTHQGWLAKATWDWINARV
ncbi:MAG TPA: hypothetical protein VED01_05115 [Burkholderiales bacterium]|nr:hypothetical protein [Burkholderiales bacterium]